MSRVGNTPLAIPQGVKINAADGKVTVEGPKGKLEQTMAADISMEKDGDVLVFKRANESKQAKSYHGLYRRLVENMMIGVSQGFSRMLVINGVGYRAEVQGRKLILSLGFAGPVEYEIPKGIDITVDANVRITVKGSDKQQVGQVAAEIRRFRPPEPYKGKGIRYDNEQVRRKVGKSGIK